MIASHLMLLRVPFAALIGVTAFLSVGCISVDTVTPLALAKHTVREKLADRQDSYLISWNAHKARGAAFTDDIRDMLEDIPPDANVTVCLQEVRSTTFDKIEDLHHGELGGHYAPSWRFPFSMKSTGVMTIANRLLPDAGARRIEAPTRELYVTSPKVSLRSEIPLSDGRQLQIINCHGLNFVRLSALPAQLDKVFNSLQSSTSPAIVCGDFNAWSKQRLKLLDEKASAAGLTEAFPRGDDHSPAPKWLGWMKPFNGFDPEIRLDRIYTRGIKVTDCYAHTGTTSSDHLPLIMSYRVLPRH